MTTINEALTPLGDGFRNLYRTGDKYSVADMAKLLSSLEIHNFLDDGQSYDGKPDINGYYQKGLTGIDINKWNKFLLGKSVIFSFDAEWSGFNENINSQKRFGFEFQTTAEDGSVHYNGTWFYPTMPSGKQYCATRMTIYDKPIQHIDYGYMYNQINSDATVKITNVKMYIDPLGGVNQVNLFVDYLKYETQFAKQEGTLYTFDITTINPPYDSFIFTNSVVLVEPNQAYKLKFKARGTGSFWTYEYGNNYQGTYVDNGHEWNLTDQWQDYEQLFPIESVPIKHDDNGLKDGFLVDIRTMKPLQGEIADIEFTPIN